MRITVGSGNPVKRDATARVFPDATIVVEPVPSGVAEQPIGHEETRTGATNRAAAAFKAGEYDLGVGTESGVAAFDGTESVLDGDSDPNGTDALYLVMWATVTNGDRRGVGTGPSLRLPASVADRIWDGEELGPVMDDVLDESNVAEKRGAAGAFTDGRMTRTDALDAAVTAAAAPFLSRLY